jgi:hypothetical protein
MTRVVCCVSATTVEVVDSDLLVAIDTIYPEYIIIMIFHSSHKT